MDNLIKALEEKRDELYPLDPRFGYEAWKEADRGIRAITSIIDIIKDHTEGHVLVPIEPTEEMLKAGRKVQLDWIENPLFEDPSMLIRGGIAYKAMINAYKESNDG